VVKVLAKADKKVAGALADTKKAISAAQEAFDENPLLLWHNEAQNVRLDLWMHELIFTIVT
jgi:hypothetical protein